MKNFIKNYFKSSEDGWSNWNRPNPEGVSTKDVTIILSLMIVSLLTAGNIYVYLVNHPEIVTKIENILFFAKNL